MLSKEQKERFKQNILKVLNGESNEYEDRNFHAPVDTLLKIISEIPNVEQNRGFETNGWYYDWWKKFRYLDKYYSLYGSGYYGGIIFEKLASKPSNFETNEEFNKKFL